MRLLPRQLPILIVSSLVVLGCQYAPSARAPGQQATSGDAVARSIADNCFACHGPDGHSPGAIPSLDRLSERTIVSRLRAFKDGSEPSTVMGRHAKAYTDAEIEAVANYIANLKR